jgi:DNA topoisomerase-3
MIVSFSKPYYYEQTNIVVSFENGFSFTASGTKPLILGWRAVQDELTGIDKKEGDGETDAEQLFPNIVKGQSVAVKNCDVISKSTVPPKLHTEATLLTAMENAGATLDNGAILKGKGIGTQATRAEIIKKLFDTGVVETIKKGKTNYIQPTSKGLSIIRVLPEELYSPKITADWETKIADIVRGDYTEHQFMQDFILFIKNKVQEVKNSTTAVSFKKEKEVCGVCPLCGNDIYCFQKRDDKGKTESLSYYCADKCGFNLDTADQTFILRTGKKITEPEAKKFIDKKSIVLECKKKSGEGTYKGIFTFSLRKANNDKTYCNVMCEPVQSVKRQ